MTKRYANYALAYALAAMAGGVFYREFTKFQQFTGKTTLSVVHTHYFLLGMFFFLLLMLAEKSLSFSSSRAAKAVVTYQAGLNITALGLLARGLTQVWGTALSRGMDASLSGVSGIGHILMGVSLVLILLDIRKKAA